MSMTTVELIARVARRARSGGDFTKLSLLERLDVLGACNNALGELYNNLPTYLKEQTQGFTLPAPLAITIGVTNGSKLLSGYAFTEQQIGASINISGDGLRNQLLGPIATMSLMNAYQGPTGSTTATIYGDAIHPTTIPFDRIIASPRFADETVWPMVQQSMQRLDFPFLGMMPQIGRPMSWWTQSMGNSQGNQPLLVLKFFPQPDKIYEIRVRLAFWSQRLLMTDYDNANPLTVPDQFLETALLPLALRAFRTSPAWEKRGDEDEIIAAADRGLAFLRSQPGQVGAPSNRIFTPVGY